MFYLASQSPRRAALLTQIGVSFTTLAPGATAAVEEIRRAEETPAAYVSRMAKAKALFGLRHARQHHLPPLPVLGADTEVVLGDRVFGKARDGRDAAEMLATLSGKTHDVISAAALAFTRDRRVDTKTAVTVSRVTFRELSAVDIARYIDSGEWQGKAGAYAIQGRAAAFAVWLEGSYAGVVGLDVAAVGKLFKG